jgi:hypothetical protein
VDAFPWDTVPTYLLRDKEGAAVFVVLTPALIVWVAALLSD